MIKKQRCYNCDHVLLEGQEFDICNRCALELKTKGNTAKASVNATRIEKRRKSIDE